MEEDVRCSSYRVLKLKIHREFKKLGQALVAHACNPSYSGGRDQEDLSSKPA
jgi:hypothetical protein